MTRYFSAAQVQMAGRAFADAEGIAGKYFRFSGEDRKRHRYDVKTLAYLEDHEVKEGTFAHLCKYEVQKGSDESREGFHFYRVCLQDDRILAAVSRAQSFIKFMPLMLYIALHEFVHVVRFERGITPFDAAEAEKEQEEEQVHKLTRTLLQSVMSPDVRLVTDCFDHRYRIEGSLFS